VPEAGFATRARELIDDFVHSSAKAIHHRQASLWELEAITGHAQAPMLRIEHALTPVVAFVIVPLFALANAGVVLSGDIGGMLSDPIVVGIVAGLVIGKQVGITAAAWLVVRAGLASLPHGVTWAHVYGAALVCGIGFTMSLFIADLAFGTSDALDLAKVGILVASVIAAAVGYVVVRLAGGRSRRGT
jgi:NhaA family Na+:H+ antiporter